MTRPEGYRYIRQYWRGDDRSNWALFAIVGGKARRVGTTRVESDSRAYLFGRQDIVTIRPASQARTPYTDAWHIAGPEGGTRCNRNARTKPVTAVAPVVTCQKCKAREGR